MRRRLVFGVGLAGLLAGSAAPGQSPADPGIYRPAPPAPPSGYVPPVGGLQPVGVAPLPGGVVPIGGTVGGPQPAPAGVPPANVTIPTALPADHPWLLRAEHGPYFICVKSYSRPSQPGPDDRGPSARELAEALAGEIRDVFRVQAFLHEHISEERRAEAAALAAARERARLYASRIDEYKQKSALQGMEFLAPDTKLRYKTQKHQDQIAVLVGPFKSDEDARKALDRVRTWAPPKVTVKDTSVMDWGNVVRPGPDGKPYLEKGYMNPYLTAHVMPNPTGPRPVPNAAQNALEPFVVKLNEGRPYNLLRASKGWTLAVKSFSAPVELTTRDGGGAMKKPDPGKAFETLEAGAKQAEQLAQALREMTDGDRRPLNLEAFVLHTRSSSMVTVGQFDGPNDPELLRVKHLLSTMQAKVTRDRTGTQAMPNAPSLFGTMMAIPIPRP